MKKLKTPGELIQEDLDLKGWKQRRLAYEMNVDFAVISKLISNKWPITTERAYALEKIFGRPAIEYLRTQNATDLKLKHLSKAEESIRRLHSAYDELAHAVYQLELLEKQIGHLEQKECTEKMVNAAYTVISSLKDLKRAGWKPKGEK